MCTCGRNHPIYSSATGLQSPTLLKIKRSLTKISLCKKCQNAGFPRSVFSHIWRESYSYFHVIGQILWLRPNTGKYGNDSVKDMISFWHILRTALLCRIFIMVWSENITFQEHWEIWPTSCYLTPTVRNNNRKY